MANVNIKPLEDRVLVQIVEAETTTASGLVIPDSAKEKPQEATVIAVGPGRVSGEDRIPMDVKEGDTVVFSKFGGTELKYNGEEFLLLSQRDILAVIEKYAGNFHVKAHCIRPRSTRRPAKGSRRTG